MPSQAGTSLTPGGAFRSAVGLLVTEGNESSGVRCFAGLHGAAGRQGGPSRRFAPVLPEDGVLFP